MTGFDSSSMRPALAYEKPLIDLASDVPEPGAFGGHVAIVTGDRGCLHCLDPARSRTKCAGTLSPAAVVENEAAVYGIETNALCGDRSFGRLGEWGSRLTWRNRVHGAHDRDAGPLHVPDLSRISRDRHEEKDDGARRLLLLLRSARSGRPCGPCAVLSKICCLELHAVDIRRRYREIPRDLQHPSGAGRPSVLDARSQRFRLARCVRRQRLRCGRRVRRQPRRPGQRDLPGHRREGCKGQLLAAQRRKVSATVTVEAPSRRRHRRVRPDHQDAGPGQHAARQGALRLEDGGQRSR